jgi:hypothetical protein
MPVEDTEWTDTTLDIVMRPRPRVKSGFVPQGRMGVRPQTTAAVSSKEAGAEGFGSLRLRPFMAGLGYVQPISPRLSVVASGMAGYSFNKVDTAETPADVPRLVLARPVYRIDNSLALEFGGRLWFDLLPRTYLMGGISFLRTRPALTLADGSREVWKADRFRLEMGVAFLVLRRP